jgi:hypothetical protein
MTMNCERCQKSLDELLDRTLPEVERVTVQRHLDQCPLCSEALMREQEMRREMSRLPVPAMRPGFPAEAFARVRGTQRHSHGRGFVAGFGSAIAASVALWFALTLFSPQDSDEPLLHTVSVSVGQVQQVNLVFNSPEQMEQATFTLSLPEHAELEGYPGQRELVWTASLHRGKNRLSLPLRVGALSQGEIVARIRHSQGEKVFRLKLDAKRHSSASATYTPV